MLLRIKMFQGRMKSEQKQISFVLALLIGGFLDFWIFGGLFVLRLQAPQAHHSIKPKPSSTLLEDSAERVKMRKQAIRALFISRNTLSFCKHKSNTKSKGEYKYIKSRVIPRCFFLSKIINESFYCNIFIFF